MDPISRYFEFMNNNNVQSIFFIINSISLNSIYYITKSKFGGKLFIKYLGISHKIL